MASNKTSPDVTDWERACKISPENHPITQNSTRARGRGRNSDHVRAYDHDNDLVLLGGPTTYTPMMPSYQGAHVGRMTGARQSLQDPCIKNCVGGPLRFAFNSGGDENIVETEPARETKPRVNHQRALCVGS